MAIKKEKVKVVWDCGVGGLTLTAFTFIEFHGSLIFVHWLRVFPGSQRFLVLAAKFRVLREYKALLS